MMSLTSRWIRRVPETIRFLLAHPNHGRIILMFDDQNVAGYSIIIQHWSNEYGGTILLIDELYVNLRAKSGPGPRFLRDVATRPALASPHHDSRSGPKQSAGATLLQEAWLQRKGYILMTLDTGVPGQK